MRVICLTKVPSQCPKRRLFVRSRKVSKPRDWYFKLSYRFEIWQAHRQHCCRSACQISERSDNSKYTSRGFETLRDLTKRRLFGYWDGAQVTCPTHMLAPRVCISEYWHIEVAVLLFYFICPTHMLAPRVCISEYWHIEVAVLLFYFIRTVLYMNFVYKGTVSGLW